MTKTREERLAYQLGYNRIKARHARQMWKLRQIARGYRQAIGAHGRTCAGCVHWTRGCQTCEWGYCDGEFEYQADAMFRHDHDEDKIATSQDFFCANWRPA